MKIRRAKDWNRLDNAAIIFPHAADKRDTKVFRYSCELVENIDEIALQLAVERTLERYPIFTSVMKHGFFWYYLERTNIKPIVDKEAYPPCREIYNKDQKRLLFKVTYFKKRINLEVFHALSDGTGAMQFLKSLICKYLYIKYPNDFEGESPKVNYDASFSQRNENSFAKYYDPKLKSKSPKKSKAYQLSGVYLPEGRTGIIEGRMVTSDIIAMAKRYNTSVTILLTAVYMMAIAGDMPVRAKGKPVVISVPINLRNLFDSETSRNFFGVALIEFTFSGEYTLENVIDCVKNSLASQATAEKMSDRINRLASIEYNYIVRAIPLVIKDVILRRAAKITKSHETSSFSNVGIIEMPENTEKFIKGFTIMVSTDRLQGCICSWKESFVVAFTSAFKSTEVQKRFFRQLTAEGIEMEIISNIIED